MDPYTAEFRSPPPAHQLPLRHQHRLQSLPRRPRPLSSTLSIVLQEPPPGPMSNEITDINLDWNGSEDRGNPMNWPMTARVFHTAVPALFSFVVILATSVYVPAMPFVEEEFHVSHEVAILGFSLYVVGIVFGSTLGAPLSELFGRRPVYLASLPLLMGFTTAVAAAKNIETILVCRFLGGMGGSAAVSVGGGTVADIWDFQKDGAIASLLFVLMPFLGPTLGPLTGAYVIDLYDDWRWSMWIILIVAAPMYVAAVFMKETSKTQILKSRTEIINLGGRGHNHGTPSAASMFKISLTRTMHMMVTEPLVFALSIYTGFSFAIIFVFLDTFPLIFSTIYGFDDKQVGLSYLALLVGFVVATINFGVVDKTLYVKAMTKTGSRAAPEKRLYCALIGSVLLPASQFWFALTSQPRYHWLIPISSGIPFAWGTLNIFLSALAYLLDAYHAGCAASATAAMGVLRYFLGAAFPLFATRMYQSLGIQKASLVFAIISLGLLPVPWVFFKFGKVLRQRSKYDTANF